VGCTDRVQLVLQASGKHSSKPVGRIAELPVTVTIINLPFQDVVVGVFVYWFIVVKRRVTVEALAIRTIVRTLDDIVVADIDETKDGVDGSSSLEGSEAERLEAIVLEAVVHGVRVVEAIGSLSHADENKVNALLNVLWNDSARVLS